MSGGTIGIQWSNADSATVDILTEAGVSSTAFTVGGSAITFPYTLTSGTRFATARDGRFTVSVVQGGREIANTPDGTRVILLENGAQFVFAPSADTDSGYVSRSSLAFNVADYGAVGDGVRDDTAAIAAALTAAAGKGMVYLQSGKTYATSSQLTVPARSRIGGGGTIKALAAHTGRLLLVQDVSDVTIEDVTLDLNKAATTNGADVNNQQGIYLHATATTVARITIRDVTVKNGWQRGIHAKAETGYTFTDVTVDRCTITDCGGNGVQLSALGQADKTPSASRRIAVTRNILRSDGNVGIQVTGMSQVDVSHNVIDGGGIAAASGIVFSSSGTNSHVTDFTCTDNKVTGHTAASQWGIVASVDCTRFVIANNTVYACTGGITIDPENSGAPGVRVDCDAAVVGNAVRGSTGSHGFNVRMCENVTITGNISSANTLAGIAISSALGVAVAGNTCNDNGTYGVAVYGTAAGSGGHAIGPNTALGNTTAARYSDGPPVACTWTPAVSRATTTSDQIVNNSTAVVDSTLVGALDANAEYEFDATLLYDGNTTADTRTTFTVPSGATFGWSSVGPITTATGFAANLTTYGWITTANVALHGTVGAGTAVAVRVRGRVTTGATAGNLQHRFAQSTADVSDTKLLAGSSLLLTRIA